MKPLVLTEYINFYLSIKYVVSFIDNSKEAIKVNTIYTRWKARFSKERNRLETLGIRLYPVENDDELPIISDRFDLVINRHGSYSASEVNRILKKTGYFITQQVGGLNDMELNMILGAENNQFIDWNLTTAIRELEGNGFRFIKMKEDEVKTKFYDIGAIVYYLKSIPWQIRDFKVDKYYDQLFTIFKYIEKHGYLDVTCHRFFVTTQKQEKK